MNEPQVKYLALPQQNMDVLYSYIIQRPFHEVKELVKLFDNLKEAQLPAKDGPDEKSEDKPSSKIGKKVKDEGVAK